MRIIGFKPGKKGTKYQDTLGSLTLESEDGKIKCNASGIEEKVKKKDISRDEFWDNQEQYLNKIVTIKCNGLSLNKEGGYNFYYPNYMCLRTDKDIANTEDEIIQIEKDVLKLKEDI